MNVYSNAFNFSSHLEGSVDLRTGQYGCLIRLMTLTPQAPLEVSREMALSFSMLDNRINSSYGKGWKLLNTEFDPSSFRLTLLSGEQHQTQGLPAIGRSMVINDHKLKDLTVERIDEYTLHARYKDGVVEILRPTSVPGPYRTSAILFENGEQLNFQYAGNDVLQRVTNQKGEDLLVLTYSAGMLVMADARIDGGRFARTRFDYTSSDNQLTQISAPYDASGAPGVAAYTFGYIRFNDGSVAISSMNTPMGGQELISYNANGHQYYGGTRIPVVVGWQQTPGIGQPAVTRRYSYSPGQNFTGYPFSGGFQENRDNLYLVGGSYTYWGEETHIDVANNDAVLRYNRATFDKFHLMIEELTRSQGTQVTTSIVYNEVAGKPFAEQPANLQLPRIYTKTFELFPTGGTSRREVVTLATDDYGNELSRTEASGVRTEYSYYPIGGESGKCPADPQNFFQRYVKQERLVPVGSAPAARLTEYTHTRVPQTGSRYVVLQESIKQVGAFETQQSYYTTPAELAGRLRSTTSTIGGLALVSNFSYAITADNLVETRRLQGREGQWLEAVRTTSLFNRRLLSIKRDAGSTLLLAFDVNGRLTSETVSPGTAQQAVRRYAYHFATQTKRAHLITTDAQGNKVISYFDGLGRQVSEAQLMGANDQERATGTRRYDALGQLVEAFSFDYLTDGQRSLKNTFAYSKWGNASRITRPDGSVMINEYEPLLNLTEEGIVGGERRLTYFNAYNQPIKVERVDANDARVEVESRTYDGLGRCLTIVDVNKTVTELTYDPFDRVLTSLEKPVDGTPQRLRKTDYAPGTSSELAVAVSVDGTRLGARTYDSLGRMTRQERTTGQATTWEYEAGWMEPVAMVSPRGGRQTLTYDKELDVPTRIEMAGLGASVYRHDPVAGALIRSETNGLIHESVQDANGYSERDVQTANGTTLTTLHGYSPGGRVLHQTSADGQRSTLDYDAAGRFSRMATATLVIEQTYDTLGRPLNLTTLSGSTRVLTRLAYDALGRERERSFEQNGVLFQVMTSTYHANSLLATRVIRNASARVVISETFTYDAYLRLKTYRCAGDEHPRDHRGRGIVGQDFSFDNLNNITRVVTFFADGTQDTSQRYFTAADPTRLTRVTHTQPAQDVTLAYDAAGNLQASPTGKTYTYNAFEQLITAQLGTLRCNYQYDAESRQVLASRNTDAPVMLAYAGDRLDTLVEGTKKIRYFSGGDEVVARSGGVDGPQLHMNDASGSVRGLSAPGQAHVARHYTPFGDAKIPPDDGKSRSLADLQLPAFNGQRLDAAVNLYFLGNGQRAYDPDLMVFLQPDPLSPFDEGGINSYAYCAGNPINMIDPSGLFPSWLKWTLTGGALALSIVTVGFAVPGIVAAAAAYTAAASAAALAAGTATAVAATAAASTAAMIVASKAALLTSAALGVVGGTLGTTALSIAEVDKKMGWDRSKHIQNLGWASLGFSIASWTVSFAGAYTSASLAYNAAVKAGTAKDFVKYAGFFDTPMGNGALAAGKRMVGMSYKFTDKQGITTFSKAYGVTRFALRTTNFGRAIEARAKAAAAGSMPDPALPVPSDSAQPQPQALGSHLLDMPGSTAGYYQSFRDEATRIRQPIAGELYRG